MRLYGITSKTWMLGALMGVLGAGWLGNGRTAWGMSPKDIYKKASPAVVLLFASDGGSGGAGGTGSIVTPDGRVLTNAHVVLNDTGVPYKTLWVFLKPQKVSGDNSKDLTQRYRGEVIAFSAPDELDLAIVQIKDGPSNLPTIGLADPNDVEVGDGVVAIGHPEQGGLWTLTSGTVSTVIASLGNVRGKDVFQTDTAINPGNSGGPLLDINGHMIGINSVIARVGANGEAITGVNYALKSSVAYLWLHGMHGVWVSYVSTGGSSHMDVTAGPTVSQQSGDQQSGLRPPGPGGKAEGPTAVSPVAAMSGDGPASSARSGSGIEKGAQAGTGKGSGTETDAVSGIGKGAGTDVRTGSPGQTVMQPKRRVVSEPAAPVEPNGELPAALADQVGTTKEKVIAGKRLDVTKATPTMVIKSKPYNMDELRRKTMRELEDLMDDMRTKVKQRSGKRGSGQGNGMGLW